MLIDDDSRAARLALDRFPVAFEIGLGRDTLCVVSHARYGEVSVSYANNGTALNHGELLHVVLL